MGTVRPGAAGKFKGKVNNAVFASWKGVDTVRNTPGKIYKRPSIKQLEQRLKFGMSSNFSSKLNDAIKIGFPLNKRNQTNMNIATKHNAKKAVIGTYPDLSIDYAQIQISKGDLAQVVNPRMAVVEGTQNIKVTWENPINLKLGVEEHDTLQFCLYSEIKDDGHVAKIYNDTALRSDCEVIITMNSLIINIHAWMFLISADKKRASITRYLGKHILGV